VKCQKHRIGTKRRGPVLHNANPPNQNKMVPGKTPPELNGCSIVVGDTGTPHWDELKTQVRADSVWSRK